MARKCMHVHLISSALLLVFNHAADSRMIALSSHCSAAFGNSSVTRFVLGVLYLLAGRKLSGSLSGGSVSTTSEQLPPMPEQRRLSPGEKWRQAAGDIGAAR